MEEACTAVQITCHAEILERLRSPRGQGWKNYPAQGKITRCPIASLAGMNAFLVSPGHRKLSSPSSDDSNPCSSAGDKYELRPSPTHVPQTMKSGSPSSASPPLLADTHIRVRHSAIHGNGVFATRKIPAGARIIEYAGKRITETQAEKRFGLDPENPHHTFFFSLESGRLIDGGDQGNDARWINHACEPNCEAQEEKGRVYVHALRDIARGEELFYDYGLVIEEKMSKALKQAYACRCGAASCRGTMLAPVKKTPAKKVAKKKS